MSELVSEVSFIPMSIIESREARLRWPNWRPHLIDEPIDFEIRRERLRKIRTGRSNSSQNDNSAEMTDRCKRADYGGR